MRFRLKAGHHLAHGEILAPGTVIDPASHPQAGPLFSEPTPDMEPLDDDAKRLHAKLYKFDDLNQRFARRP